MALDQRHHGAQPRSNSSDNLPYGAVSSARVAGSSFQSAGSRLVEITGMTSTLRSLDMHVQQASSERSQTIQVQQALVAQLSRLTEDVAVLRQASLAQPPPPVAQPSENKPYDYKKVSWVLNSNFDTLPKEVQKSCVKEVRTFRRNVEKLLNAQDLQNWFQENPQRKHAKAIAFMFALPFVTIKVTEATRSIRHVFTSAPGRKL